QLNWPGVKNALVAYGGFVPPVSATPSATALVTPPPRPQTAPALTMEFLEQIAQLVGYMLPALGGDDLRFNEQAQTVMRTLRMPNANADIPAVKQLLVNFSHRLSFAAEDQAEIKLTLLRLLQLIIENIGTLSPDDRWLQNQVSELKTTAAPPLTLRRLDELAHRLKDVIQKQGQARDSTLRAQEEMRQMLAVFIERLSQMTESTSSYHGKLEETARLIEQARSINEITPVLKEIVGTTRVMAKDSLSARDELRDMREKAAANEAELARLHQHLDRISAQVRHDPLTGALNRKGLDEALEREIATVRRKDQPLSVSLLDIDNFTALNDRLGHETGDAALAHLAKVAREAMRPQDSLARFSGAEFVVLLPDTGLDEGIAAMTRLQRELSKRFFLTGSEKLLITFSAGVAQLASDESGTEAIRRADQAMYLAKRAGKNRVLGA
ncbi:MAG: diguanylate cyclase, partial [Rhodoferax sp.]|nr:diguanylate cyclase [Rhodoferax sp.]